MCFGWLSNCVSVNTFTFTCVFWFTQQLCQCQHFYFQVLAAVSQLSSLFSGLRTLSHSSSGRPQRKKQSATASNTTAPTHDQQTRSSAEELLFSAQLVRLPMHVIVTVSGNYSLKFRWSESAWGIYFFSSRGSPRILKGSHQLPWILTLSEDENPNFSRPAMLVATCHVIRLFCTWLLKISQATKHQ